MTRFARAKGSKSSNQRVPESSTPWHEMKEELHKKQQEKSQEKEREKMNEERESKYNNYLQELESKTETVWSEVTDEPTHPKMKKKTIKDNQLKKSENEVMNPKTETNNLTNKRKNKKKNKTQIIESATNGEMKMNENTEIKTGKAQKRKLEQTDDEIKRKPMKNNKQLNKSEIQKRDDDAPEEISSKTEMIDFVVKKQKIKKNKPLIIQSLVNKNENEKIIAEKAPKRKLEQTENNEQTKKKKGNNGEINNSINSSENQQENNNKSKKRRRNKKKTKSIEVLNKNSDQQVNTDNKIKNNKMTDENDVNKDKKMDTDGDITENLDQKVNNKNKKTKKNNKKKPNNQNDSVNNTNKNKNKQNNNFPPKKIGKIRDDKEHPRRKPDNGAQTIFLNGKTVKIVKFEGFPVKKDDADRLTELRGTMIKKGVPRSEIRKALQLERRRAEKSLARDRKNLCYHCRKSGHILAECPEMMEEHVETLGTGICFKCGSTEHMHFECKVTRTDTYKFATCFICKEQGHIAKQCPDNPKGMYPKGGACKLCGDVTHLKKDCPTLQERKDNGLVVNTITDDNLEGLGNEPKKTVKVNMKNENKVVTF